MTVQEMTKSTQPGHTLGQAKCLSKTYGLKIKSRAMVSKTTETKMEQIMLINTQFIKMFVYECCFSRAKCEL